jgi:hypothetical protein
MADEKSSPSETQRKQKKRERCLGQNRRTIYHIVLLIYVAELFGPFYFGWHEARLIPMRHLNVNYQYCPTAE